MYTCTHNRTSNNGRETRIQYMHVHVHTYIVQSVVEFLNLMIYYCINEKIDYDG